jgi:hypothetical protein
VSEQKNYHEMSDSEKKKEDWMNNKWRPMMGWMYMAVCMADFVLFPVLWGVLQTLGGGKVETQWMPITLQGAGLFHMAMGAILGIAAFGRTQEKLAGANNGGMQPVAQSVTTTYSNPSTTTAPITKPATSSFTPSYSTPAAKPATFTSASGKPGPILDADPEL